MSDGPVELVSVMVDGRRYGGITSGHVATSFGNPVGSFSFDFFDRWTEAGEPWPIRPGSRVAIEASGDTLLEGHVESVELHAGQGKSTMRASGRSLSADLADCTLDRGPRSLRGLTAEQAISHIVAPFEIPFFHMGQTAITAKQFSRMRIRREERALEVIQRICRILGFFLLEDAGVLWMTHAAQDPPVAHFSAGAILSGTRVEDHSRRFSTYTWVESRRERPRAQVDTSDLDRALGITAPAPFTGQTIPLDQALSISGPAVPAPTATVTDTKYCIADSGVGRYRPMRIRKRGEDDSTRRVTALREARVRAGQSEKVEIIRPGFRGDDGELLRPNQLTTVDLPSLRAHGLFLTSELELSWGPGEGQIATLTLVPPATFSTGAYPLPLADDALGDARITGTGTRQVRIRARRNSR